MAFLTLVVLVVLVLLHQSAALPWIMLAAAVVADIHPQAHQQVLVVLVVEAQERPLVAARQVQQTLVAVEAVVQVVVAQAEQVALAL
jgi:hypothetical protein